MQVTITLQPDPLLTSADDLVRQSLFLDGTDRDELADLQLLAAQGELDGPLGKLGFSVAQQSVQVIADSFDCPAIRLPGGPISGVVVVTYLDGDGATQTLDDATYLVASDGTLTLVEGGAWPTIASQANAVTITYDVGIADPDDPRVAQMKHAILMRAKEMLDPPDDGGEASRKAVTALTSTLWVPSV